MKNLTQKELLAQRLLEIKKDITIEDKKMLMRKPGFSKATVSTYLNGKVYDNDKAANIIRFMDRRIQKRNTVLIN